MSHSSQMNVGLKVDSTVNLTRLQEFLGDKGTNDKLYAKKQGDGFVLYIKPSYEGAKGKIANALNSLVGFNSRRREDAREALSMIINTTRQQLLDEKSGSTTDKDIRNLLGGLRVSITDGMKVGLSHAHKVGDLSKSISLITDARENSNWDPRALYKEKARKVYDDFHVDPKNDMKELELVSFADGSNNEKAPILTIDGEKYVPNRLLGQGGLGRVIEYTSGGKALAVKIPLSMGSGTEDHVRNAKNEIKEIQIHRELSQTLPESVVTFKDVIKTPGSGLIVVSTIAKGGDVEKVGEKLRQTYPGAGGLPSTEGRKAILTVLSDFGTALDRMHRIGGMAHLDVKGANALLDENGVAKLTDFGTTRTAGVIKDPDIFVPDTPYHTAPELLNVGKQRTVDTTLKSVSESRAKIERNEFKEEFSKIFKTDDEAQKQSVEDTLDNIFDHRMEVIRIRSNTEIRSQSNIQIESTKADVWSFGTTVLRMFTGELVLRGSDDPTRDVIAFMNDDNNRAVASDQNGNLAPGSLIKSTGDQALDDFLNFVMKPKPEQRPTMQQVMSHPFMTQEGVGSERSREILKNIASGRI